MAKQEVEENKPKKLGFLHGDIKTPPFSEKARKESGYLLRRLQSGETLGMPSAEPLPIVGPRCGALRVRDEQHNWRIMYRVDPTTVLVIDVYDKKTRKIPDEIIDQCKKRLKEYDKRLAEEMKKLTKGETNDGR
jgi:phage-related protein